MSLSKAGGTYRAYFSSTSVSLGNRLVCAVEVCSACWRACTMAAAAAAALCSVISARMVPPTGTGMAALSPAGWPPTTFLTVGITSSLRAEAPT